MQLKKIISVLLTVSFIIAFVSSGFAKIEQIPQWYKLSAYLENPPELGKEVKAIAKLQSFVGDIDKFQAKIILPESWTCEQPVKIIPGLKKGKSKKIEFLVTPKTYLSQASILIELSMRIPKKQILLDLQKRFPNSYQAMAKSVKQWPSPTKRYTEIPLALLKEESFYPLTGNMWLNYDKRFKNKLSDAGPVYFDNNLITSFQAQTDLEMYEKLQKYLKTDPGFATKLKTSGIDIERKNYDHLIAINVLATRAYQKGNFKEAILFIERLEKEFGKNKSGIHQQLQIAGANIKGLSYWGKGQKRLAENTLKKAFYKNRKHKLQRYILRNLGLLMLSKGDKTTAKQMFKLGLQIKPAYTQLKSELEKISQQ